MERIKFALAFSVVCVGVGVVIEMFLKTGLVSYLFSFWFYVPAFLCGYILEPFLIRFIKYK